MADPTANNPNDRPADVTGGITTSSGYREVTLASIIFGLVIGTIMNAAITYAGLKIGFTIGGSAIAAVLGFGVLRGLLRKGSILETNIAQTIASAVNTSNSGVIFTVPVLFLMGINLTFGSADFWLITAACVAGAILGAAFIIPLRKQMIDIERLRFPSATGVASILKSPGAGPAKAVVLVLGVFLGAVIYAPAGLDAIAVEANLDNLDTLVEQEFISETDAERTRTISQWIEQQSAPDDVIARGELLSNLRNAREHRGRLGEELARAIERDRPRADLEALYQQRQQAETQVETLQADLDAIEVDANIPDDLARAAFEASTGEQPWHSLSDRKLGWASRPLLSYRMLQWRLPAEEETPPNPDTETDLALEVDRDSNGNPDLLLTADKVDVGRWIGLPAEFQLIFAIAPFALGAGFITGRAGLFVLAGGILAFFVLNPIAYQMGWLPDHLHAHQAPDAGFVSFNRPLGIGLLLGGAIMGVVSSLPAIKEALKSIAASRKSKTGGGDELGLGVLIVAVIGAFILLYVAADIVGNRPINDVCPVTGAAVYEDDPTTSRDGYTIAFADAEALAAWTGELPDDPAADYENFSPEQRDIFVHETLDARPGWLSALPTHWRSLIIAIVGALWIWFAGIIIAQCTGMTDWSPISGLALLTVVLVLLLAGSGAVIGAVLIGAALCVAITLAADMMGDLRTGYLVGGVPRRQQIAELLVVGIGPVICMMTLMLIVNANVAQGFPAMGAGSPTPAPQAEALRTVIQGVQGGELPYALYGMGALLGILLGFGAFAGMGVLVGLSMYLPFYYISTYGIGCLVNMGLGKIFGRVKTEEWGVPFAAGLIVGESVLQLILNMIVLGRG